MYVCIYVYASMYVCFCFGFFLPMRVSNKSQYFHCLRSEV